VTETSLDDSLSSFIFFVHYLNPFGVFTTFTDNSSPIPQISRHPSTQNVLKGKNVTLRCQVQVFQKNDSNVRLSWRHDSNIMTTADITNHARVFDINNFFIYQCFIMPSVRSLTGSKALYLQPAIFFALFPQFKVSMIILFHLRSYFAQVVMIFMFL
jgi:hypothetical protein